MEFEATVVRGRSAPEVIVGQAPTVEEARRRMLDQGYSVLSLRATGAGWLASRAGHTAIAQPDVDLFVEQLRDLLSAGLSLVEALATLQRASTRNAAWLDPLVERLRQGQRLSDALSAEPAFPALLVALVRASELTSDLARALDRFLDHRRKSAALRDRIVAVAIYPALLTGVGALVLLFLLLYVMPRFARVFEGMSGDLPWSARAMVSWAQWLSTFGPLVYLGLAATLGAVAVVAAAPSVRARLLQRLLDTNWLRQHLRVYFLARWYRGTGMLVDGGIPLSEALALSRDLLPLALQRGAEEVRLAVRDGLSPSDAHARGGMLTPVAEQLMLAGERTGDLGAVLARIAQFHEAEVSRSLERFMKVLEPAVMVFIGLGVGIVVVLMYLPIFELASAIQ